VILDDRRVDRYARWNVELSARGGLVWAVTSMQFTVKPVQECDQCHKSQTLGWHLCPVVELTTCRADELPSGTDRRNHSSDVTDVKFCDLENVVAELTEGWGHGHVHGDIIIETDSDEDVDQLTHGLDIRFLQTLERRGESWCMQVLREQWKEEQGEETWQASFIVIQKTCRHGGEVVLEQGRDANVHWGVVHDALSLPLHDRFAQSTVVVHQWWWWWWWLDCAGRFLLSVA
jgi:hypothetical protein